jgi:hypothetical protein
MPIQNDPQTDPMQDPPAIFAIDQLRPRGSAFRVTPEGLEAVISLLPQTLTESDGTNYIGAIEAVANQYFSAPGQDFSEEAAKAVSSLFDLALKVVSRVNSYHERQSLLQEEVAKLMGNLSVELMRRGCTGTIVLLANSLTNAHRSLEDDANDLFLPRLPKGSEG